MNRLLLAANFIAEAAILGRRLVVAGTADGKVLTASGSTKGFVGVSDSLGQDTIDGRIDVQTHGLVEVVYGGSVAAGDPLTSDATGRAIKADFAAGTVVHCAGIALVGGVANDIGSMRVAPHALANESLVVVAEAELTSEQILALYTTPIELIAAPAAGKAIVPVLCEAYKPAGTAYAGIAAGEDLAIKYTNASGTILFQFETTGFLDQATAQTRLAAPSTPVSGTNLTPTAAAALVAHMLVDNIITGDSPIRLRIWYRLVDMTWGA